MAMPTRADLDAAAGAFFEEERHALDQPRDFASGDYGDGPDAWVSFAQARIKQLEDQLQENRFDGGVRQRARRMAETAGSEFAALDQKLQLHVMQLAARGERQAERWLLHLLAQPWSEFESDDALFRAELKAPILPVNHEQAPRTTGTTVREAVAKFLDHKHQTGVGSSQYEEIERALRWLRERAGDDRDFGAVTKEELRALRDAITRLDSRLRGRASMSLEQRQTADPEHWIRSVTAARYWASILAFFQWCKAEGLSSEDPSDGLKIARRRGEDRRSPEVFRRDELERLFKAPLYSGHKSPTHLLQPGSCHDRGSYYWTGLIGLYTGMRAGEIAQLRVDDFDFDAEVPIIHVREEDAAGAKVKRTKNKSSVRDVPIATTLLKLGFREFVAGRRRRWKAGRLFRDIYLGPKDRTSGGMSAFWGRMLRAAELHAPGRSFHVMRHTAAAAMRRAGVSEETIGAVLGHAPRSQTGRYGGPPDLQLRRDAVEAIDYGIDVVATLGDTVGPKASFVESI